MKTRLLPIFPLKNIKEKQKTTTIKNFVSWRERVLLIFLILSSIAWSQSNYNTVTGTLGTTYNWIDCSAGTTVVSGDDTQASINWPFNFNFYQSAYTTANSMSIATNGFIRMDGVANGADYNAAIAYDLTSAATTFGQIVALAMYDGYVGRIPASSWLKYLITGTAPNRILTVEYRSLEISYNQNLFVNTQVSFYETLNKIVLKLGTDNITASGVDMGIHSGTAGYFNKWQEVLTGTNNTWIEYTPAIEVNATSGSTLGYYGTLKAAFDKINDGTHQGNITIHVQESTNETAAAVLNASGTGAANYVSVNMYPTSTGKTITGNLATPLIDLNGADNVIIDGRVDGTGSTNDLTISNTNNSTTAGTSTIRLINDATNNTIKYCNINGSERIATSGVLFFSTANTGSGNDANTIDNNNITSSTAANRPINAIYSLGTAGKENSENIISNNNIYDFLKHGSASNGIFISSNSSAWTIDGNSFYETTSFISTATVAYNAIQINNATGDNFSIVNNYIGGSSSLCGGTAWTKTIASNNVFNAINLKVGTTTASSIQNNTIQNFNWSNSSAANWSAINVSGGNVNIGTTTGNTIGAATGNGSITVTGSTNGQNVYGINISSSGTIDCQKNTIGSITTANGATLSSNIFGIYKSATVGVTTISYNNIGSSITDNSFDASSTSTSNPQSVYGISNAGTGTITISNNTISKLTNENTSPTSNGLTNGIASIAGTITISNNTIYDLTNACGNPSSLYQASVCGIALNGTLGVRNVTRNVIYNLSNTYASFTGSVIGIFSTGPTSGNTIQSNFIHSLSATGGNLFGIKIGSGSSTYSNNIINVGGTNPTSNYGIYDTGGASQTCNLYFNTIYVGGSVSAGAINSYAIYSAANTNTRNYRNNIFSNARANSGGTGKHYGIYYAATGHTFTVDYNDYYAPNSSGMIGYYNGDQNTLALLRTATAQDANSLNTDPLFASAGGTVVENYYSSATLTAVAETGITVGFYGILRNTPPKMGALESNDYIWQGNTDTDFGTGTNWVNGVVPLDGSDISFAASPANDCLLDHNHSMRSLTNAQSAKKFVVNGKQLTITGDLIFSNGAQMDATAASSVVIFAGTAAQNIPSGAFVSNTIDALTLNNSNGLTQNGDIIIPTAFTLTSGAYTIGANSLTLNGSITATSGTLTGGSSSNIVIGGSGASTTLPGVSLNNLTLNRSNGLSLGGNVSLAGTLTLTAGTLTIAANTLTLNTNAPTLTSGNIDASNANSSLILNNIGAVTVSSSLFSSSLKNLTLSGNTTLTASSNLTVNGILNLASANPTSIKGSLDMGAYTLNMGSAATTIGQGDVTGTVTRTSFALAIPYTFGNQYTTMTFGGNGEIPSSMSFKISIGAAPAWKTNAVQRQYDIVRVGGTAETLIALQLHYLDGELNGNTESNMVTWDFHVNQGNLVEEHGKAAQNITDEWISISNRKVTYFDVAANMHPWALADKVSASFTWQGTPSTDWNDHNNWAGGDVPTSTSDVIIPDAAITLHDPLLPTTATAKTILIQQGGILDGGTGTTLTITGGSGAWLNLGTLNPGTSTVIFTNANATMADPTNFYNVSIAEGASLTPETGNVMRIAGALTEVGTGILRAALLPNTIEFNGADQTINNTHAPIPGYYTLILSGAGTKTLPNTPLNIADELIITGTATATANSTITIGKELEIQNGATFVTGNYNHNVGGHFDNAGTFTPTAGTSITLNGAEIQNIYGTTATSFEKLIISNVAGVNMFSNITVNDSIKLSNGNLNVGTTTLSLNGAVTKTSGFINANPMSSFSFGGTSALTLPATLFYNQPSINNLTVNRTGGVIAGSDITVNGVLNLQSVNPSATVGALNMDSYTLNMGENATTVGIGDVTGVVRRTTLLPNIDYTFGNQFTYLYFSNEGTLPTELKLKISIGTAPTWRSTAVQRVYDLIQTGASGTRVLLNGHYLDSELNGNDENLLVDLQYIYPLETLLEKGRSNINTTDNWVSLSNTNVGNLFSSFGNVELGFSAPSSNVLTWNGSVDTSWINSANWTPNNSPSASSILIIPDATTTPNDPILPASSTNSTLEIQNGGILNSVSDAQLTLNGGEGAWSNSGGTFNASSSTVIFTNAQATMSGTTNFNNITINNGAVLYNSTGSMTRIAGTVTNNGTWRVVIMGATTVEYNGGDQSVVVPNMSTKRYYNLILSGSGTKSLPSTLLNINGDLTLLGTVTTNTSEALSIAGNLNIGSGTTFDTRGYDHFVGGNFVNNGTFIGSSGKSISLNGTTSQTISGSSTTNFDILTIDNAADVNQSTPITVATNLALNQGDLIVGNTTLGIDGTISKTAGYLSVSDLTSLNFGGTSALTLNDNLFTNAPTVNNLTINRSGGVTLGNQNMTVDGTLELTIGTLTLAANTLTIAGNSPTRTSGNIDASNAAATLAFTNTSAITLPASIISGNVNNLTINGTGLTVGGDMSINGILNLQSANPSSVKGSLDMNGYTLSMGATATTTGIGDVIGIVKREHTFNNNLEYSFGNQFTNLNFLNVSGNAKPTWVSCKISIGTAPTWGLEAIKRYYSFAQSGGTDRMIVKLHYLDSELHGSETDETKLVFWDAYDPAFAANNFVKVYPRNHNGTDATNNYIQLTGPAINYLATSATLDVKQWGLSYTNITTHTWTGNGSASYDGDWSLPGNWNGGVPNASDDVVIPTPSTLPIDNNGDKAPYRNLLPDYSTCAAKTLEIEAGATLDASAYDLTITGDANAWVNNGTFNAGNKTVIFSNGDVAKTMTIVGTTNFNNLTVAEKTNIQPATNSIIRIGGTLDLNFNRSTIDFSSKVNTIEYNGAAQTVLNPNGTTAGYYHLTLSGSGVKSLPSSTLEIIGNLNMNGNATVTTLNNIHIGQNMNLNDATNLTISTETSVEVTGSVTNNAGVSALRIKSSPTSANGSFIFHNTSNNPSATVEMYSKAAATNTNPYSGYKWQFFGIPISSVVANPTFYGSYIRTYSETTGTWTQQGNSYVLSPFTGYEITQPTAKTITFSGQLVNSNFQETLTYTTGAKYPGQHVYGNPYTSAINISNIKFGSAMDSTVYLYNTGSYADWTNQNGVDETAGQYIAAPVKTAGVGGIPGQISSMQGFLVKALSNSLNATIEIPYSSVAMKNTDKQRVKAVNTDKVYTRIDVTGTRYSDKMWVFTDPSCTRGFDNGWDGYKFMGSSLAPQLWAAETTGDFQVDAVDNINNTYLKFMTGEDTNYTLKFTHESTTSQYPALYLVDLDANKTIDITQSGTTYSFTATKSSTSVNRFKIVTSLGMTTDVNSATSSDLKVYGVEKTIFIKNSGNSMGKLNLYDIVGRLITELRYNANCLTTIPTNLASGTYFVKGNVNNAEISSFLIIK